MSAEPIGVYDQLAERKQRAVAFNSPAVARRIQGEPPRYHNAQTSKITVNLKTGARTVERVEAVRRPPKPRPPAPIRIELPAFVTGESFSVTRRPLSARNVLACVAEAWGLKPIFLTDEYRSFRVSRPRTACYRIMYDYLPMTFHEVGQWLGKRDHTSVVHGWRRSFHFHATLPDWRERYDAVIRALDLEHAAPLVKTQGRRSSLSEQTVEAIRASTQPQMAIARKFGIAQSQVSRIKSQHSRADAESARGGGGAPAGSQPAVSPAAARLGIST